MKKILSVIFVLSCFSCLFGLEPRIPNHDEPKKKEVILVGKIKFTSSMDNVIEGYRKLFYPKSNSVDDFYNIYFVMDDDMEDSWYALWKISGFKNWDLNTTYYFDVKPNEENNIIIPKIRVSLFANKSQNYFFDIPLNIVVSCPEDAKYIYIGTYEIDVDYLLNVKDIKHYEEFDSTKEEIDALYGKYIDLVRGDVQFLN